MITGVAARPAPPSSAYQSWRVEARRSQVGDHEIRAIVGADERGLEPPLRSLCAAITSWPASRSPLAQRLAHRLRAVHDEHLARVAVRIGFQVAWCLVHLAGLRMTKMLRLQAPSYS